MGIALIDRLLGVIVHTRHEILILSCDHTA